MSAPLSRVIWDISTDNPSARLSREIENHHHIASVARNTAQMRDLQAAQLHMQAQSAAQMHQDLSAISFGLDDVNDGLIAVQEEMAAVNAGIDRLQTIAEHTEQALYDMHAMLDGWLAQLSGQLLEQQETMTTISEDLLRPLEVQVQELRRHADHALESGMASTGSTRAEWYSDAMELLVKAVDNPVGKQDYVAWFQIGWLRWKALDDPAAAEDAFARAARLASPTGNVLYVESLRHLAYMQYLQGNHSGVLDTIKSALESSADAEVIFDGARYEAVNGHQPRALELLEQAIRHTPPMIIRMLGEPDFQPMTGSLAKLADRLSREARQQAADALAAWEHAVSVLSEAVRTAECGPQDGFGRSRAEIEALGNDLAGADYLRCLAITRRAREARAAVVSESMASLETTTDARRARLGDLESRRNRLSSGAESEKAATTRTRDQQLEAAKLRLSTDTSLPVTGFGAALKWGCGLQVLCTAIGLLSKAAGNWGPMIMLGFGGTFVLVLAIYAAWRIFAWALTLAQKQAKKADAIRRHEATVGSIDAELARSLADVDAQIADARRQLEMGERGLADARARLS